MPRFVRSSRLCMITPCSFFRTSTSITRFTCGSAPGSESWTHLSGRNAADHAEVYVLEGYSRDIGWHADVTFEERPARASVLRSVSVPRVGATRSGQVHVLLTTSFPGDAAVRG